MEWKRDIIILCIYGFLKELRPSEPFLSPFLNGPHRNFTEEEINQKIYPVATYSNLSLLVVVFLLTDWLKYKPIVIVGGVAGIITWTILPLAKSIVAVQAAEFFYGLFSSTEVAYYSYMYAKLSKKYYQRATSLVKAAILLGKATSGLASQGLLHFCLMDYLELNYLTLGAITLATCWAFYFPSVSHSVFFHSSKESETHKVAVEGSGDPAETEKLTEKNGFLPLEASKEYFSEKKPEQNSKVSVKDSFKTIFSSFKSAISDKEVLKWSLWWSASLCGYLQVISYMQLIWQSIINSGNKSQPIYHGYISTVHCVIGAICTYLVGFLKLKWNICGEIIFGLSSVIEGVILYYSTKVDVLTTSYMLFISFRAVYQSSNTIVTAQVAKHILSESYALIFGINTFVAILAQSILTLLVIDYFKLDIKSQYFVYSVYHLVIGVVFVLCGCYTIMSHWKKKQKKSSPSNNIKI